MTRWSRMRSPALSWATRSVIESHSGVAYSGWLPDVEVQPGAVLEEHVRRATPADHAPEQVAGDLVGRQATLPAQRAGDAVLVLEPEDPPVHVTHGSAGMPACTASPGRGGGRRRVPCARVATPLMVHLTTVGSLFEARVVMARLGAEGILTQLRGGRRRALSPARAGRGARRRRPGRTRPASSCSPTRSRRSSTTSRRNPPDDAER